MQRISVPSQSLRSFERFGAVTAHELLGVRVSDSVSLKIPFYRESLYTGLADYGSTVALSMIFELPS